MSYMVRQFEASEKDRARLKAELARYKDAAGRCDQNRHMADAAVAALGFPNREEVSPYDITEAIRRLRNTGGVA